MNNGVVQYLMRVFNVYKFCNTRKCRIGLNTSPLVYYKNVEDTVGWQ